MTEMQGFLRSELVDRSIIRSSSVGSRAVKNSGGAGDHSVVSKSGSWSAGKTVWNGLGPRAIRVTPYLENDSAGATATAGAGSSIQVSGFINGQGADGAAAIAAAFEAVENAFNPGAIRRAQLIDCADVMSARVIGRAVQIARLIKDQAAVGQSSVRLILKSIKRSQGPGAVRVVREFEYYSVSMRAAYGCDAVEISGGIEDQAPGRTG